MKFLGFKRILLQSGEKVVIPDNEVWVARITSGDTRVSCKPFFENLKVDYEYEDKLYPQKTEIKTRTPKVIIWAKAFSADNAITISLKSGETISVPNDEVWLLARTQFNTVVGARIDIVENTFMNMNGYRVIYPGTKIVGSANDVIFVAFRTKKLGGVNV